MKKISRFIFSVFLLLLVLLGSGQFTIGKMICGDTDCAVISYSLGKAKDCCTSQNTSEGISSCCCQLINVSYALDEFSVSEKTNLCAQGSDLFLSPSVIVLPLLHFSNCILSFSDSSPPPSSKNQLYLIGSLRI